MIKFDESKECCHYCEYRHGGCCHTDDEIIATYDGVPCGDFELGSCYSCAIHQAGDEAMNNLCDSVFWPSRCINYKEGIIVDDKPSEDDCCELYRFDSDVYSRSKHRKRRMLTRRHKMRLKTKAAASSGWYGGLYYDKDRNRVIVMSRGSVSKFLKRVSNKRIRQGDMLSKGGLYKKSFDYWWNIN